MCAWVSYVNNGCRFTATHLQRLQHLTLYCNTPAATATHQAMYCNTPEMTAMPYYALQHTCSNRNTAGNLHTIGGTQ